MKCRLAVPGRGGLWNSFLRTKRIPRTTADRLIARYEASTGVANCTSGAVSADDERQHTLERTIQKLEPLLLGDWEAFCGFVQQLAVACNVQIQTTEHGLFIPVVAQSDVNSIVADEVSAPVPHRTGSVHEKAILASIENDRHN